MQREVGDQLAISIGTALAIEPFMDDSKDFKHHRLSINLRTLFRNYAGAFTDDIHDYKPREIQANFLEEVSVLSDVLVHLLPRQVIVDMYVCSFKSLRKRMPYAVFKTTHTSKQQLYLDLENRILDKVLSKLKTVSVYDSLIKGRNSKGLIITHSPVDLLSASEFRSLELLESHTGKIKSRNEWTKKLTSNDKYSNLPFNPMTLQLLGDHSLLLRNMGPKYIKPVLELAIQRRWSTATTLMKVKYDLQNIRDPLLATILVKMLNTKLV